MSLFRLHKLACRLLFLRPWCLALSIAGVLIVIFALMRAAEHEPSPLLRIGIITTLWSLLVFAFIQLFQRIPPPVLPKDRLLDRIRSYIKLGLYKLLAISVAAIGIMLLSMSLKLLML